MSAKTGSAERTRFERYVQEAIAGFERDPPDTDYQRGYLAALLVIQKEAFEVPVV